MKLRPVLLLTGPIGSVPEVLVAYISSVVPPQLLPSDLLMDPLRPEWQGTGLKVVSVLRLHKLATVHCPSLVRHLGQVTSHQSRDVIARLSAILATPSRQSVR